MAIPIQQRIEMAHKHCDSINRWAPQFSADEQAFWKSRSPIDRLRHLLDICRLCSLISLNELPESHFNVIYDTLNVVDSNLKTVDKALIESSLQTAIADFTVFINRLYDHEWKEHHTQFRLFSSIVTTTFLLEQSSDKHVIELRNKFATQKAEVDALVAQTGVKLSESIQLCQTSIDNLREQSRSQKSEFDEVLEKAKDKVAQSGVAKFHDEFGKRATKHENSATNWMHVTLVAVLITAGIIFWFFDVAAHLFAEKGSSAGVQASAPLEPQTKKPDLKAPDTAPPTATLVQEKASEHTIPTAAVLNILVTRVLILSLMTFLLYWCARNYRANCHLAIVYRQKELSLRTFEAFAAAAHDKATRNAILLATTRFIFSATPTGYLGKDESGPSDKLIEVLSTAKE